MLPLLLAYECVPRQGQRNVGEVLFSLPLAPFGRWTDAARVCVLAALACAAVIGLFRSGLGRDGPGLLPRIMRVVLEGAGAALLLGPALLLALDFLGVPPRPGELAFPHTGDAPPLAVAAFLAGGAAWEEIVFRIGVQSLVFLAARHALAFLTASTRVARASADVLSIAAGAAVFAASHLGVFTQVLGPGGERFVPAVFTWRLLAGMLLGALFRWRGPGVAAWAHALFDLFLAIGASPGVRSPEDKVTGLRLGHFGGFLKAEKVVDVFFFWCVSGHDSHPLKLL
jgi:hypothetical protein